MPALQHSCALQRGSDVVLCCAGVSAHLACCGVDDNSSDLGGVALQCLDVLDVVGIIEAPTPTPAPATVSLACMQTRQH